MSHFVAFRPLQIAMQSYPTCFLFPRPPFQETVITLEERDDLLMRVESLNSKLDVAERHNIRVMADLDETQAEMADTLEGTEHSHPLPP